MKTTHKKKKAKSQHAAKEENAAIVVYYNQGALERLKTKANEEHKNVHYAARAMLTHAKNAGVALLEAKKLVEHGMWTDWLFRNFHASHRTANDYMMIARYWQLVQSQFQGNIIEESASIRDALRIINHFMNKTDERRAKLTKMFGESLKKWNEDEIEFLYQSYQLFLWKMEYFQTQIRDLNTPSLESWWPFVESAKERAYYEERIKKRHETVGYPGGRFDPTGCSIYDTDEDSRGTGEVVEDEEWLERPEK